MCPCLGRILCNMGLLLEVNLYHIFPNTWILATSLLGVGTSSHKLSIPSSYLISCRMACCDFGLQVSQFKSVIFPTTLHIGSKEAQAGGCACLYSITAIMEKEGKLLDNYNMRRHWRGCSVFWSKAPIVLNVQCLGLKSLAEFLHLILSLKAETYFMKDYPKSIFCNCLLSKSILNYAWMWPKY